MTSATTLSKLTTTVLLIAVLIAFNASGADYSIYERDQVNRDDTPGEIMSPQGQNYDGALRVFVIEPLSRWNMNFGGRYHYAVLGFAMDIGLDMVPFDTNTWTVEWNGLTHGYSNVAEDNIMVIGAVYNGEGHSAYSDPGEDNHPFTAHYVDAAAAAHPGETGRDTAWGSWTHTGFTEKGTATWCVNCPYTAAWLKQIYDSGDYPWYFAAFVTDEEEADSVYMDSVYNLFFQPACFFDGGYSVKTGGSSSEGQTPYRTHIEDALQRPAADLDLEVSLTWLGASRIQVDVMACYNTLVNQPPNEVVIHSGPSEGEAGTEYQFQSSILDPEQNQHYARWDWGDGDTSEWFGPYDDAQIVPAYHTWTEPGTYTVRLQGKDIWDAEGPWSGPHEIVISPSWICGDVNGDQSTPNIIDLTYLVDFLVSSGSPPPVEDATDLNGDGEINMVDLNVFVDYFFTLGEPFTCGL